MRFIVGLIIGVCLTGSVATAAGLGEWRQFSNEEITCSIGKPGTGYGATCVAFGVDKKYRQWGIILDADVGVQVTNGNGRVVFTRGPIGR